MRKTGKGKTSTYSLIFSLRIRKHSKKQFLSFCVLYKDYYAFWIWLIGLKAILFIVLLELLSEHTNDKLSKFEKSQYPTILLTDSRQLTTFLEAIWCHACVGGWLAIGRHTVLFAHSCTSDQNTAHAVPTFPVPCTEIPPTFLLMQKNPQKTKRTWIMFQRFNCDFSNPHVE